MSIAKWNVRLTDNTTPMSESVPKSEFGKRLVTASAEAGIGIKQSELAKKFGVKQPTVNHWLSGEKLPTFKRTIAIAEQLGVCVEWLLTGRGDKRPSGSSHEPLTQDNEFGKSALEAAEWVQRTPSLEIQAQLAQGVKEQALIYIREKEKEAIAEAEKYRRIRELHDEANTISENSSSQNGLRTDPRKPSPEDIESN